MKKLTLLLSCFVLAGAQLLFAQSVTITGKVTGKEDGAPIPGVSIQVKGTTIGTITNFEGKYSLSVPQTATSLVFSFVGMKAVDMPIEGRTTIDVVLEAEALGLDEVVLTAFAIKRSARELGYATAKVNSKELTEAGVSNVVNGLSGKVSGLQINTINNGVNPETKITLRGNRHLLANNQALVVLDGVPVSASYLNSINPNDIESVNILKGSSASALYGNDASNGVLIIATKKGGDKKPVIRISNTTIFEHVSYFPEMQTRFGGGSGEDTLNNKPLTVWTGEGRFTKPYTPYENQSYGPEYTGQMVNLGGPLPDGSQNKTQYSYKTDNKKNFFVTGVQMQNDVSYSQGDENNSFYISAQDVNTTGTTPKDKNRRTGVRFTGARTYNIFRAEYTLGYTQTNTDVVGGGFFQNRPVYWNVMNTPGQVPLQDFKDIVNNPYATPAGYFNAYYTNPYWQVDHSRQKTRTDDLLGSMTFSLTPASWIDIKYRTGITFRNQVYNSFKDDVNIPAYYSNDPWGSGGYKVDNQYYYGGSRDYTTNNLILTGDLLITLNKKFNDLTTKLTFGNSIYSYKNRYINLTADQVEIPNFYNVSNVIGIPTFNQETLNRNSTGVFGDLSLGYKEMIFLHASGRNDWDSRLAANNRSFFYPGADLSFVVSEAIPALKGSSFLSFAKLRAGWSKTGQVSLNNYYATLPAFDNGPGFPFGNTVGFKLNAALSNPNLKPELTQEIEGGLDLSFLQNKVHLGVSVYKANTTNQTIPANISAATGFSTAYINAGELESKGYEVDLKFTPLVFVNKFSWSLSANYSYTMTKVVSLLKGLDELSIGNFNYATVGEQYPLIKQTDWVRDTLGRIIVDGVTGLPVAVDSKQKAFGHANPNHILGIVNTLTYGRLTLNIVAEYRSGNVIYNTVGRDLDFTGISWHSALNGRQSFVIPNSVIQTGPKTYVPNTNVVVQDAGYTLFTNSTVGQGGAGAFYITSAAFWKIREVSLSFDVPVSKLWGGNVIRAAQVSLIGRNLLMFRPATNKWADPEFNASVSGDSQNATGYTTSDQTPATRYYGFSVNLTF